MINRRPNKLKGSPCHADGCDSPIVHKTYCYRHYKQMKRYGKTFDTIYQEREAIIDGDTVKIPLGVNAKYGYAIVDKEFAWLNGYKWTLSRGYAVSHDRKDRRRMHRMVMGCPDGMVVDHINHNGLDNRKANLRVCEQGQNIMNMTKPKDNKSGYKGVFWDKTRMKWCSKIGVNKKEIHVGYFTKLLDAAYAYNEAAKIHHGEFAYINEIKEG